MKIVSKSATVDDIMSWHPCWIDEFGEAKAREMIVELFGPRDSVTALDIMRSKCITDAGKHWLVLRPEVIDERTLHLIACDIVEQIALPIWYKYHPNDDRPAEAIRIKRLWLDGQATDDELSAARRAARSAIPTAYTAADVACAAAAHAACAAAPSAADVADDADVGAADAAVYAHARGKISEIITKHLDGQV